MAMIIARVEDTEKIHLWYSSEQAEKGEIFTYKKADGTFLFASEVSHNFHQHRWEDAVYLGQHECKFFRGDKNVF